LKASICIDEKSTGIDCEVWDISDGGAKLAAIYSALVPDQFILFLSPTVQRRCQVKWRGPKFIGVKFVPKTEP
jgi:hypothetical protein